MNEQQTTWVVDVPVATIWTSPSSPREIDRPGITNPVLLEDWYNELNFELRKGLCEDNRVQSQLLYGEEVIIEETDGDWSKVIAVRQPSGKDERGYPGWVPTIQLKEVKRELWNREEVAVVTKKQANLIDHKDEPIFELSFMTYLPIIEHEDLKVKVQTPSGEAWLYKKDVLITSSIHDLDQGSGKEIVETGKQFLSLSYFWGGMSAFGYDCSGFSYNMHKAHGYEIPRDASDQAKEGVEVPKDQLGIGDLLFFAKEETPEKITHVGIYYGDDKMIHAPMTGKGIEIIPLKGTKYEKEFRIARRYHKTPGE